MQRYTTTLIRREDGFTLIETLVAAVVLTIGIFALYSMQTTAIKFNSNASIITTSSTWASDRIERLLALSYDDPLLADDNDPTDAAFVASDGQAGLDTAGATADGSAVSPDGNYTLYWNTADYMTPNPSAPTDSTLKAIRVIVRHNLGITAPVVLNYYKQKTF